GGGTDWPGATPPGARGQLQVVSTADGGIDATWEEPNDRALNGGGIAGYFLGLIDWGPNGPRQFDPNWQTQITTTGLSGHISADYLHSFPDGSTPSIALCAAS